MRLYVCVFRRLWSWSHVLFQGLWSTLNNWPKVGTFANNGGSSWNLQTASSDDLRKIIKWSSDNHQINIRWSSDDHRMIFGWPSMIRLKNITKTQGTSQPCKKRRWERSSAVFILKVFSNCKCNVRHEMVSRQKNSIQLRFQGHGTSQLSKSWKMSSWLSQRIFRNETNIWSKCSLKMFVKKWSGSVS